MNSPGKKTGVGFPFFPSATWERHSEEQPCLKIDGFITLQTFSTPLKIVLCFEKNTHWHPPHIPSSQTHTFPQNTPSHSLRSSHIPTHTLLHPIISPHTYPQHTSSSHTPTIPSHPYTLLPLTHRCIPSQLPHTLTSPQASHNHSSHISHTHPLLYSQAQPYLTQHKYASSLLIPILAPSLPSPFPSSTLSPTHKHFPIYLNFNLSKAHWSPVSLMKFFGIHLPFDDFFWSWISYSTGFQLFSHAT